MKWGRPTDLGTTDGFRWDWVPVALVDVTTAFAMALYCLVTARGRTGACPGTEPSTCEGKDRGLPRNGTKHPVMMRDYAAALTGGGPYPSHCDLAIATVAETDGAVPGNGFQDGRHAVDACCVASVRTDMWVVSLLCWEIRPPVPEWGIGSLLCLANECRAGNRKAFNPTVWRSRPSVSCSGGKGWRLDSMA